jgi:hypothetical protein
LVALDRRVILEFADCLYRPKRGPARGSQSGGACRRATERRWGAYRLPLRLGGSGAKVTRFGGEPNHRAGETGVVGPPLLGASLRLSASVSIFSSPMRLKSRPPLGARRKDRQFLDQSAGIGYCFSESGGKLARPFRLAATRLAGQQRVEQATRNSKGAIAGAQPHALIAEERWGASHLEGWSSRVSWRALRGRFAAP